MDARCKELTVRSCHGRHHSNLTLLGSRWYHSLSCCWLVATLCSSKESKSCLRNLLTGQDADLPAAGTTRHSYLRILMFPFLLSFTLGTNVLRRRRSSRLLRSQFATSLLLPMRTPRLLQSQSWAGEDLISFGARYSRAMEGTIWYFMKVLAASWIIYSTASASGQDLLLNFLVRIHWELYSK